MCAGWAVICHGHSQTFTITFTFTFTSTFMFTFTFTFVTFTDFASLCWLSQASFVMIALDCSCQPIAHYNSCQTPTKVCIRMDCFIIVGMLHLNRCAIYCREWLPSSHHLPTVSSCTRAGKRPACSPSCHPRKQSSESLELPMKWTACCSGMPSALLRHQDSKGLQLMPLQALLLQAMVPNMTMSVLVYAMEGWCCVWWEESCQRASTSVMALAGDSLAVFHEDLDVEYGVFMSKA